MDLAREISTLLQKLHWEKNEKNVKKLGGECAHSYRRRQTFPLQWVCTTYLDNNASEAEEITDLEIEEGESSNSLKTLEKSKGPNLLVRNAETNFGRQSKPSLCTSFCWCNTPRYLRASIIPTFQVCLGKPRVICRRGTLTQFQQRVAIGRTRMYTDKQYVPRIEEFTSMMLSFHRRIISFPKRSSKKDQQENVPTCHSDLLILVSATKLSLWLCIPFVLMATDRDVWRCSAHYLAWFTRAVTFKCWFSLRFCSLSWENGQPRHRDGRENQRKLLTVTALRAKRG